MTSNPRYSMHDSMDIRCSRCGYENSPQFRFCGMCGASLRPAEAEVEDIHAYVNLPPVEEKNEEPMPVEPLLAELTASQKLAAQNVTAQKSSPQNFPADLYPPDSYSPPSREDSYPPEPVHGQRTPIPVSGPSFLGLSESSDQGAEYLLEDEPRSGGRKAAAVVILLLLAAGAGLFWHWYTTGYPWARSGANAAATPVAGSSTTEPAASTPSETAPPAIVQKTEKPKSGEEQTTTSDNGTPSAPATEAKHQLANPAPESPTAESQSSEEAPEAKPSENPTEAAGKPSAAGSRRPVPSREARIVKPTPPVPSLPDPAQDSLYLQGQKYLYGGGGVPPNCARAQQYLTSAANNNNPKAESTLGTMYATGHCAPRDLPLAYRWFARALHADPKNTRLERDVEIMWNQMSPQEKQLALKSQ